MKSVSFEAVESAEARVLILGTLPSVKSLAAGQYYAHPRNCFWWIMGGLIGAAPELPYVERLNQLRKSGIALWDVCKAAERAGSSDAKIAMDSVEPNDFKGFLRGHPRIELICFNGQPAERLFRRKAMPLLADLRAIPQQVLDSTSPACARLRREEKLARWRKCLEPFLDSTPMSLGQG
jgi:hypoxanthine-DNA glycosylase